MKILNILFSLTFVLYVGCGGGGGSSSSSTLVVDPEVEYYPDDLKGISLEQVSSFGSAVSTNVIKLSPVFSKDKLSYTVKVSSDVEKVRISASAASENSKIKINGIETKSNKWSKSFSLVKGTNSFSITVLPTDSKYNKKTYSIVITKEAQDPLTAIEDIDIVGGDSGSSIYPPFDPEIHEYYMAVPYEVETISLENIKIADGASLSVYLNDVKYEDSLLAVPVNVGNNYIKLQVNGSNGEQSIYRIVVNRADGIKSNNADLLNLTLSNDIEYNPVFNKNIIMYGAMVNKNMASVTVTAEAVDSNSTIKVNGLSVNSGSESQVIELELGINSIFIEVTPEDGILSKTYVVEVEKLNSIEIPEDRSADLSNIEFSSGISLTPEFDSNTYSYSVSVSYDSDVISINPVLYDTTSSIRTEVNGVLFAEESLSNVSLSIGNNDISISVKSSSGLQKVYNITINRAERTASNIASLSNINLTCGDVELDFKSTTLDYTFNVDNEVEDYSISAVKGEEHQTVKIDGVELLSKNGTLDVGENVILINVVSEDLSVVYVYKITINRSGPKSNNNYLGSMTLTCEGVDLDFDKNEPDYEFNIHNYVTECAVTLTKDEDVQKVTINDEEKLEETFSNLRIGENIITIIVTAEDGSTRQYNVRLNRADVENNDADLVAIDMSGISLIPVFDRNRTTYSAEVPYTLTSTSVSAELSDEDYASIKINGEEAKGKSITVNLAEGQNSVTIDVTAQDPRYTKKYIVTVYRAVENKSNNSALNGIGLSPEEAQLSTLFSSNILDYTAAVPYSIDKIFITPVRAEDSQKVLVNGAEVDFAGGQSSVEVALEVKKDNLVTIQVIAEDEIASRTYQLYVNRAQEGISNNANLTSISMTEPSVELKPGFNKNLLEYNAYVDKDVESIIVTSVVEDSKSSITVNGLAVVSGIASDPVSIVTGDNLIKITVTAEDGTIKEYELNVNRATEGFSNDASLSSLSLNSGTLRPEFNNNVYDYAVTVDSSVETVSIYAVQTVDGKNARVLINGNSSSESVSLATGYNFFEITSIAQDGKTRLVYTLSILRPVSGLTVYFKMPVVWGVANSAFIYYEYGSGSAKVSADASKSPMMTKMGKVDESGVIWTWWSYTIPGVPDGTSVNIIFKNSSGSNPGCYTGDLTRSATGWFIPNNESGSDISGTWYSSKPSGFGELFIEANPHFEQEGEAIPFNDTKEITLLMGGSDIDICKYSLDGSDPSVSTTAKTFVNNMKIIIGQTMSNGDVITLKLYAKNSDDQESAKEYSYVKTDKQHTVHFKRPSSWGSMDGGVVIHQWYELDNGNMWLITGWSTCPDMTYDGNGWYSYYIEGLDSAGMIFKLNNNVSDAQYITVDLETSASQSGYWFIVDGNRYAGGGDQYNRLEGDWYDSQSEADSAALLNGEYTY